MFQVSLLDRGCPFVGNGPKYPSSVLLRQTVAFASFLIHPRVSRLRERRGCLYRNAKFAEQGGGRNLIRNKDEILEKFRRSLCIAADCRVPSQTFCLIKYCPVSAFRRIVGDPISLRSWLLLCTADRGCLLTFSK